MNLNSKLILVFFMLTLFLSGCPSEPEFDKSKFADLGRTAEALKTAITSSEPCSAPQDLEQQFAAGIAAVKDKTTSKLEHDVVVAYMHLLTTYQDGLLLCRSRGHFANFQFFPKDRIYVTQYLDPVVQKYDLPVEKHLYKQTGEYLRSVDVKSIDVVWESALAQIQHIETTIKYN